MASTASSSLSSVTTAAYSQLRVQQAQRNADRADQEARALRASAHSAEAAADRAQEGARNIRVQSDQATDFAGRARSGVEAMRSTVENLSALGLRAERVAASQSARDEAPPVAPPAASVPPVVVSAQPVVVASPVINSDGQTTGTLIDVSA